MNKDVKTQRAEGHMSEFVKQCELRAGISGKKHKCRFSAIIPWKNKR